MSGAGSFTDTVFGSAGRVNPDAVIIFEDLGGFTLATGAASAPLAQLNNLIAEDGNERKGFGCLELSGTALIRFLPKPGHATTNGRRDLIPRPPFEAQTRSFPDYSGQIRIRRTPPAYGVRSGTVEMALKGLPPVDRARVDHAM